LLGVQQLHRCGAERQAERHIPNRVLIKRLMSGSSLLP
jgi:hypothetical protein